MEDGWYVGGWDDEEDEPSGFGTKFHFECALVIQCRWSEGVLAAGPATEWWTNGDCQKGTFDDDGDFSGPGTYWRKSGRVDVVRYEDGVPTGEGVSWSADRTKAWRLKGGHRKGEIKLDEARAITSRLGFDGVPDKMPEKPRVHESEAFGPGTSRYCPHYLTSEQEQPLLAWCRNEVPFQIYQCVSQRRVTGGEPRLKAPKAEYYLLDEYGRRPHYKWTQLNDFDHAGQPMPPILEALCDQLNADFGLTGDDRLNHCLIICNEQGPDGHCAPPHADKIQKGFFFDVSLGYARTMKLIDAQSKEEVASQKLASGSLAFITAADNGRLVQGSQKAKGDPKVVGTRYLHTVLVDPDQPRDQPRFSIVFRPITDHPKGAKRGEHLAKVDEAKAARVQSGGDLWRAYVPLCRGGNGAESHRRNEDDESEEVRRCRAPSNATPHASADAPCHRRCRRRR